MGMESLIIVADKAHYYGDYVKELSDEEWAELDSYCDKHTLGYWRRWYGLNDYFDDRLRRKEYRQEHDTVYNIAMFALDKSDVKAFSKEIEDRSSEIYMNAHYQLKLTKKEFKRNRKIHRKLVKKMKKAMKKGLVLYYECSS